MTRNITWAQAIAEVGEPQETFLHELLDELLDQDIDPLQMKFQLAPSIMTRSELELFGASAPRFALRLRLPNGSFLNLRRFAFLSRALADIPWLIEDNNSKGMTLGQVVSGNLSEPGRSIADSVLIPPYHRFPKDEWKILCAPLGRAYGECCGKEDGETYGTPFLRQVKLGGGMCAQAACFMVAALMHEHSKGVHGVSEITSIAKSEEDSQQLELGGIKPVDMARYFNSPYVGLSSMIHTKPFYILKNSPKIGGYYRFALRTYVLSGFPVIQTLDAAKLWKHGGESAKALLHAVVIVGAQLNSNESETEAFLVQDPSDRPFVSYSCRDLLYSSTTVSGHVYGFLPVLPAEVKLPLFDSICDDGNQKKRLRGLEAVVADAYHRKVFRAKACNQLLDSDQVRLINLENKNGDWRKVLTTGDNFLPEILTLVQRWADSQAISSGWFWTVHHSSETYGESLTLYDATLALPFRDTGALHLAAACRLSKDQNVGRWKIENAQSSRLQMSVLTSYTAGISYETKSTFSCVKSLGVDAIEFYCFMQELLNDKRIVDMAAKDGVEYTTVLEFMAIYAQRDHGTFLNAIDKLAELVFDFSGRVPIIALASFIPTLSLPAEHPGAKIGQNALMFLHVFAGKLIGEKKHNSPKKMFVEIVAGSRVEGVFPVGNSDFLARISSNKNAVKNLVENIDIATKQAISNLEINDGLEKYDLKNVIFAIELEPGPLFAVNGWNSIKQLCRNLDIHESEFIQKNVGLNLDVAHWRMAKDSSGKSISPELVRGDLQVFRRIVHSHISGHHAHAHFGDIPLGALNELEEFSPWISLLQQRMFLGQSELPFSGFVSLEYEAAKSEAVARDAILEFAMFVTNKTFS